MKLLWIESVNSLNKIRIYLWFLNPFKCYLVNLKSPEFRLIR